MEDGDYYVVRIPAKGKQWIVESRPIQRRDDAGSWLEHIQDENPKDNVFMVRIIKE